MTKVPNIVSFQIFWLLISQEIRVHEKNGQKLLSAYSWKIERKLRLPNLENARFLIKVQVGDRRLESNLKFRNVIR